MLGDKIANSLLRHDEQTPYQETQLDILFERQRWLPGDAGWSAHNIFDQAAHLPFISPTNEALEASFNDSVGDGVGGSVGPSQNMTTPIGLPPCKLGAGVR